MSTSSSTASARALTEYENGTRDDNADSDDDDIPDPEDMVPYDQAAAFYRTSEPSYVVIETGAFQPIAINEIGTVLGKVVDDSDPDDPVSTFHLWHQGEWEPYPIGNNDPDGHGLIEEHMKLAPRHAMAFGTYPEDHDGDPSTPVKRWAFKYTPENGRENLTIHRHPDQEAETLNNIPTYADETGVIHGTAKVTGVAVGVPEGGHEYPDTVCYTLGPPDEDYPICGTECPEGILTWPGEPNWDGIVDEDPSSSSSSDGDVGSGSGGGTGMEVEREYIWQFDGECQCNHQVPTGYVFVGQSELAAEITRVESLLATGESGPAGFVMPSAGTEQEKRVEAPPLGWEVHSRDCGGGSGGTPATIQELEGYLELLEDSVAPCAHLPLAGGVSGRKIDGFYTFHGHEQAKWVGEAQLAGEGLLRKSSSWKTRYPGSPEAALRADEMALVKGVSVRAVASADSSPLPVAIDVAAGQALDWEPGPGDCPSTTQGEEKKPRAALWFSAGGEGDIGKAEGKVAHLAASGPHYHEESYIPVIHALDKEMRAVVPGGMWFNGRFHGWSDLTGGSHTVNHWKEGNESGSHIGMVTRLEEGTGGSTGVEIGGILLPVAILPDYNRDGTIDDDDRGKVSVENPWRWWVNDDDDYNEVGKGGKSSHMDVPGYGEADTASYPETTEEHPATGIETTPGKLARVDGMRDLVDFFPLYLGISKLLEALPPDQYVYEFDHPDDAFNFVVRTDFEANTDDDLLKSGAFLRDLSTARDYAYKPVLPESMASGEETPPILPVEFLEAMIDNPNLGVVLIEASKETEDPLELVVKEANGGEIVGRGRFPVKISEVEKMYRHVDLRTITREYDGSPVGAKPSRLPTQTADPADPYPDELTNGKYFVYMHGFNVNGTQARGANAEIFKRLHQMGSRARFVGISWNGDTGIANLPDFRNLDYHKAVVHAFQTGDELGNALEFTAGSDVTLMAHSLGNVAASHALAEGRFTPSRYYLMNAAVALETYHTGVVPAGQQLAMTEKEWEPYGAQQRLFAARWSELFPEDDHRSRLTWRERFAPILLKSYNFYSPGEDVVENPGPGDNDVVWYKQLFSRGRGAWYSQEFIKGPTHRYLGPLQSRNQAGWKFNSRFRVSRQDIDPLSGLSTTTITWEIPDPADTPDISDAELRTTPFFGNFLEPGLMGLNQGSAIAGEDRVLYDVLARGIPALSYAAAANEVDGFLENYNMPEQFRTDGQWPLDEHEDNESMGQWLHGDFRAVALSYVYQLYE